MMGKVFTSRQRPVSSLTQAEISPTVEQANLGRRWRKEGDLVQASGDTTHDPNAMVGGVLGFLSSRTPDLEQNIWK